jgi:hypothetical protein
VVGNRIRAHSRFADCIIGAVFGNQLRTQNVPDWQFTEGKGGQDLIHGQDEKMTRNARKKKSIRGLDEGLENQPQSATSELERRVIKLENDVEILKQLARWPVFNKEAPTDERKKPGAKERIEDEDLFKYRDGLTRWLEAYWPWMEDRLCRARSAEEVGAILEAVSEEPRLEAGLAKAALAQSSRAL